MIIRQVSKEDFVVHMDESDNAWDYQINQVSWYWTENNEGCFIHIDNQTESIIHVDGRPIRNAIRLDVRQFPVQFTLHIPCEE